jgi:CheY-like chemotaxis protein/HPt (histidine-containing phosphotransfer) domain-containing protein
MLAYEAATPSEALTLLHQATHFDLALLDMNLPEMDGATLALEICACCDGGHSLPLVMLTSVGYEYRPEVEQVACFAAYLTKPVKPSQLYDVLVGVLAAEGPATPAPQESAKPSLPAPGLLAERLPLDILLAEDVAVNQKFALLALEEMGYRADVAANGLEVLAALERRAYDVILMDVQMPEMDGLEATRRIRQIWAEKDLRGFENLGGLQHPYIIAMTANALQGDREMCLEAGMDDYVSKPVYLDELRAAVERAGQNRKAEDGRWRMGNRQGKAETTQSSILHAKRPSSVLDPAVLEKLLKRPTGRELISSYLTEAAEMLDALRQAMVRQDAMAVAQAAHSLRGSSSYVGAQAVVTLSGELEQVGRWGVVNDEAAEILARLEEALQQTRHALTPVINI